MASKNNQSCSIECFGRKWGCNLAGCQVGSGDGRTRLRSCCCSSHWLAILYMVIAVSAVIAGITVFVSWWLIGVGGERPCLHRDIWDNWGDYYDTIGGPCWSSFIKPIDAKWTPEDSVMVSSCSFAAACSLIGILISFTNKRNLITIISLVLVLTCAGQLVPSIITQNKMKNDDRELVDRIHGRLQETMVKSNQSLKAMSHWHSIQLSYCCCGLDGSEDWTNLHLNIPSSCDCLSTVHAGLICQNSQEHSNYHYSEMECRTNYGPREPNSRNITNRGCVDNLYRTVQRKKEAVLNEALKVFIVTTSLQGICVLLTFIWCAVSKMTEKMVVQKKSDYVAYVVDSVVPSSPYVPPLFVVDDDVKLLG